MSLYGPDQRRQPRVRTRQPQPDERPEYLACSICGNPVPYDWVPGGGFPGALTTTGSTYVWTSPDEPITTCDLTVFKEPAPGIACPLCIGTRFLDGTRGTQ